MLDSDWSRKFLLRSDWLVPIVALITTYNTKKETDLKRLIPTKNVYHYCLVLIIVCYHFTV